MKLQDELSKLDKAWQMRKPQIMLGYFERPTEPVPQLSKVLYILAASIFILTPLLALYQNSGLYFIFGLCISLIFFSAGLDNADKTKLYFPEKELYENKRQKILDDLRSIYDSRLAQS